MRLLLDTHIFLWWDSDPHLLPAQIKNLCEDSQNTLILSVASIWEMQSRQQLGKLSLRVPLSTLIEDQQKTNSLEILPVSLNHVLALEHLPLHHKDPFDRLLIAQSNSEDIGLLSVDKVFTQ